MAIGGWPASRIAVPLMRNTVKPWGRNTGDGHDMGLRIPLIRRYPPPNLRAVVVAHRSLGPLLLVSLLVVRHPGLDEGDDIWGCALVVWGLSMTVGLGGAARLLLARGPLSYRLRAPSALLVAGFILGVARWHMPGSPPLATELESAVLVMFLAAPILGIWAGWSTPLQD